MSPQLAGPGTNNVLTAATQSHLLGPAAEYIFVRSLAYVARVAHRGSFGLVGTLSSVPWIGSGGKHAPPGVNLWATL